MGESSELNDNLSMGLRIIPRVFDECLHLVGGLLDQVIEKSYGKVLIFPEGTRSMDGKLLPGKRSVGRLIQMARPIIVPAAVWGTILGVTPTCVRPRIGKEFGVRFGPPLDMEAVYRLPVTKESSQQVIDHVMSGISRMVEELKAEGRVIEI